MHITNAQLEQAMGRLGVDPQLLRRVGEGPHALRVAALAALKDYVRRAFRRIAPELHPDRHPGEKAKAEEFLMLREIVDAILAEEVPPPSPARPVSPQSVYVVVPCPGAPEIQIVIHI